MGKKQKKAVTAKVEEEVPKPEEEMEIKTEDDIKEETEEAEMIRNRKARLIVRNISFKATEDKLREHFSQYGELTDVKLLRNKAGRLVGCGFVEYSLKNSAAKAIARTSGKPFLNRPVVVDWAIQKDKFVNNTPKAAEDDSEESGFHDDNEKKLEKIKEEDGTDSDDSESSNDSDKSNDEADDGDSDDNDDDSQDSDEGSSDDDDSDSDEESDSKHKKKKNKQKKDLGLTRRKPLRESHDISECCTVFVKNIPFSVSNEDFKKCMRRFGLVYYALICIDHLTEHSKGTGFVKFRTKEAADACLAAGREGEITINGSVVETLPAQNREDLVKGAKNKDVKRDSRHLYLVKEGIILAGSPASVGVSQTDMAKRLQLEQWKTQMLRNLNKFVSRYRVVVQNLPPSYDDAKLRSLMMKYGGKNPVITEARVMRDLRNVDANGVGKSKEFGFVQFTTHENAIHALRTLNNNPDVFTAAKRPIVAFSIEDKKALNTRQKRLEKSKAGLVRSQSTGGSQKEWEQQRREGNNQFGGKKQGYKGKMDRSTTQSEKTDTPQDSNSSKQLTRKEKMKLKLQKLQDSKRNRKPTATAPANVEGSNFMGETSKPGQSGIMSRKKMRAQVELQAEATKAKSKNERKRKQQASVKIKQPMQKLNKSKMFSEKDDKFSNLVNKYKTQLVASDIERKKWYDQ